MPLQSLERFVLYARRWLGTRIQAGGGIWKIEHPGGDDGYISNEALSIASEMLINGSNDAEIRQFLLDNTVKESP